MADPTVDGPLAAVDAAIGQIETDLQGRIHLSVQGLEQYATQGPIQRPIQLGPQKKLWVAFSGGLDSSVLLDAAWRAYGEDVRAIHVNHQLQHEAARWETHCRAFADARGITLTVRRVTVGRGNLEAEARRARYDVWGELLPRGQVLLVAHHGNDQAETVLWKLFTGRHPSGMPKLRKLGSGWLLRPFLALHREAICAYARHRGLQWVEDPMNDDESYARIYIRKRVLPAVVARYPGFIDSLCSDSYTSDTSDTSAFASDASDASDRFDQSAAGDADPLPPGVQEEPDVHRGPLAVTDASPASLRDWLGIGVGDRLIAEIGRQAGARRDADPVVRLPNGLQVRRYRGELYLVSEPAGGPAGEPVARNPPKPLQPLKPPRPPRQCSVVAGRDAELGHGVLSWREASPGLAPGTVMTVRYRSGGEKIRPQGRGHNKSLKALFQENAIAPWLRGGWPLLYVDEMLVAVPDIALAEQVCPRLPRGMLLRALRKAQGLLARAPHNPQPRAPQNARQKTIVENGLRPTWSGSRDSSRRSPGTPPQNKAPASNTTD